MNPRTPQPEGRDPLSPILARWMADSAPHAVSDRTLDAVTAATATVPQRGRRGPWLAVLATAAAAAAVAAIAIVAFGLPGRGIGEVVPSPSSAPSPAPTATGSPTPSPTQSPSPSPSPTAEASAEEPVASNEILLRFVEGCDVIPPVYLPSATVMSDGRVVWVDWPEDPGSPAELKERRLSPEGLDAMRSMVEGTGLFGSDGDYPFVYRADAPEPPGQGYCVYTFSYVPPDGGPVTVTSAMWFGDEYEATYFEPSPERKALDDLAQVLRDPEEGLATDAWEEAASRPYDAAEFLVVATLAPPEAATLDAPDVDALDWPFPEPPDAFGEPVGQPGEGAWPTRCGVAIRDAIAPLLDQLVAAGLEQFARPFPTLASVTSPWASHSSAVELMVVPRMPDGAPGCDAVNR